MSKEKKQTLGLTVKKNENFSEWYTQVIQKSEMAHQLADKYMSKKDILVFLAYLYSLEIEICVATCPFSDVPMLRDVVDCSSMKKSSFLLRYDPLIDSVSVISACLCAAASLR